MDLKKIFRSFILLAVVFVLALACVACSDADENQETNNSETVSDVTDGVTVDKEGKYTIFENGEYAVRVVFPEKASNIEKDLYDQVRNKLSALTGVTPERITDFKAYNDDGVDRAKPAILIGNTNYDESKQIYGELGYSQSRMTVVGNKLVMAFSSDLDANRIYTELLGYLRGSDKTYVGIDASVDSVKSSNDFLEGIPKYPVKDHSFINLDNDNYMIYAEKAKTEDLKTYSDMLESIGFKSVNSREECGNIFKTLVLEEKYAYMYYSEYNKTACVIIGPEKMLGEQNCDSGLEEKYTPYIASIPQPDNGEGYIIRLADGRFIIVDAGYKGDDRVYKTLRELEEGEIRIAAWFISHPHSDHYPAFIDFIKDHGSDESITIEQVMFNYAASDMYNINGSAGADNSKDDVELLYTSIRQYIPKVPIIKLHTGQIFDFDSASVEILYTIEDLIPDKITNINDSSLVLRVNVAGQSILLLTDTCYDSGPILNNTWGEYLKSDIMQIAHHGCYPSVKAIYDSIQAETVLFPAMYKNVKNYVVEENWAEVMNAVLGYAKDIYVSGDHMEIIELPYVVKNNKEEMLEYIKNY